MTVLSDITFAEPNPPTTSEAIREVERHFGITFPEDYRAFLLKYNGGYRPDRSIITYPHPDGIRRWGSTSSFWGVLIGKNEKLNETNVKLWGTEKYQPYVRHGNYPIAIFPFAMDAGAGHFCIGIKSDEPNFDRIFFHEPSAFVDKEEDSLEDIDILDMTFSEFFNNLMTEEDADKLERELKGSNKP
ncbi:MAG: SMI1/KNR4 family protein [Chloroflexota bacterium]